MRLLKKAKLYLKSNSYNFKRRGGLSTFFILGYLKVIVFSTTFLLVLLLGGIFKIVYTRKTQAIEREKQVEFEAQRLKAEEEAKRKLEGEKEWTEATK